jgi:hypothetical protein
MSWDTKTLKDVPDESRDERVWDAAKFDRVLATLPESAINHAVGLVAAYDKWRALPKSEGEEW